MRCKPFYRAEVSTREQLSKAVSLSIFRCVYTPPELLINNSEIIEKDNIIIIPPVFLGGDEKEIFSQLSELKNQGFKSALAHTLGHINLIKSAGLVPHGGARLNVTNYKALKMYESLGLADCILSFELKIKQAENIISKDIKIPLGITAYGRLPLMLTRRCPVSGGKPCRKNIPCKKPLTDRLGNNFPIICRNTVEILNPDKLILSDKSDDLKIFDFLLFKFTDENEICAITSAYENNEKPDGRFTRGLYYKGVK